MTDKELILKLHSLRQIKPRQEWVIFAKNQIFGKNSPNHSITKTRFASAIANIFSGVFVAKRRMAYSVAVFLFLVAVGTFFAFNGLLPKNSSIKIAKNSTASLIAIKDSVEEFKEKSKNLSEASKYSPEKVSLAVKEVKDAVKELTEAVQKDPQLAKEIALEVNNNKTYLEISGSSSNLDDLKETSDTLYKAIVEQMIKDLEGATLIESQKESIDIIKSLHKDGNYVNALENILLLNIAINQVN